MNTTKISIDINGRKVELTDMGLRIVRYPICDPDDEILIGWDTLYKLVDNHRDGE